MTETDRQKKNWKKTLGKERDRLTDRQTDRQKDRQRDRQTLDLLPACTVIIRDILKFKKTSTNSISYFLKKYKNVKK